MTCSHKGSCLRTDIARVQKRLDEAQKHAVEIDQYGAAWQHDRGYWYRAYDSDCPLSSWELAQRLAPVKTTTKESTP